MADKKLDTKAVLKTLNLILEAELAGVVRYTQYQFMVFGYSRIPTIHWLQSQATEALQHSREAGEIVTHIGGQPSLEISSLLEKPLKNIGDILRDALVHERQAIALYRDLLAKAEGRSIVLEEYARTHIGAEELHVGEIEKMLRHPGH